MQLLSGGKSRRKSKKTPVVKTNRKRVSGENTRRRNRSKSGKKSRNKSKRSKSKRRKSKSGKRISKKNDTLNSRDAFNSLFNRGGGKKNQFGLY